MPCVGYFQVTDDAELEAVAACSQIVGELSVNHQVTTLQPLACLRQVDGLLGILQSDISNTSGLAALETADMLAIVGNSQLSAVEVSALELVGELMIESNQILSSLDFPALAEIWERLEIAGNPALLDCDVEALFLQANPPVLACEGNLPDTCSGMCG